MSLFVCDHKRPATSTASDASNEVRDGWVFQHITSDRCCQSAAKAGWDAAIEEVRRLRDDLAQVGRDWAQTKVENKRLREALEKIASVRCAWQLSQEIASDALKAEVRE